MIATVLAGAAGILIAPIANLDPTSYTLFIVPALGVALVGRFESFWIIALAGLLLGMGQSEIIKLQHVWTWLPAGAARCAPVHPDHRRDGAPRPSVSGPRRRRPPEQPVGGAGPPLDRQRCFVGRGLDSALC